MKKIAKVLSMVLTVISMALLSGCIVNIGGCESEKNPELVY